MPSPDPHRAQLEQAAAIHEELNEAWMRLPRAAREHGCRTSFHLGILTVMDQHEPFPPGTFDYAVRRCTQRAGWTEDA